MKRLINMYYDFLLFLEDVVGGVGTAINNHRKRLDDRYWDKYLQPIVLTKQDSTLGLSKPIYIVCIVLGIIFYRSCIG